MRGFGRSHAPSRAQRLKALALINTRMSGRRRTEALAWVRDPHRTGIDISAFIDRLQAKERGEDQR